jgi:hypothetical protein
MSVIEDFPLSILVIVIKHVKELFNGHFPIIEGPSWS